MEFDPDGNNESLIPAAQERTALRTHYLLVAARLVFAFSHGALLVSASAALGMGTGTSWWTVFIPVWLGDVASMGLIVYSWFASCPYIKLCLKEHQARIGDPSTTSNPSILTELFPELVMAIFGVMFVALALVGEVLLCGYLVRAWTGQPHNLVPGAVVFIFVASLAGCRSICISTHADFFGVLGVGTIATFIVALCEPPWPSREGGWVLALPPVLTTAGLLVASILRLRQAACVLSRQERALRYAEEVVLIIVLVSFAAMAWVLARPAAAGGSGAAFAGVSAGSGICVIAALRACMALVESRSTLVCDRLVSAGALAAIAVPLASQGSSAREATSGPLL